MGAPQDARTLLNLAHLVCRSYSWQSAAVVVCVVTGFQEYEIDAFLSSRRFYGDERWIDGVPGGATPGQVFSPELRVARRDVRELLAFMLAYAFEGYFVLEHGDTVLWAGDDVIEVSSRRPADIEIAKTIFNTLELSPTDWSRALMARRRASG